MSNGNQFGEVIKSRKNERENQNLESKKTFETKNLLDDMNQSKKKHSMHSFFSKKDSQEYRNVQVALTTVAQFTSRSFEKDVAKNEKMITDTMGAYYKLLSACSVYMKKRGGKSDSGKARKEKVQEIEIQAKHDLAVIEQAFFAIKSMNAEQQSQLTWDDIIHSNRIEDIEVETLAQGGSGATKTVFMTNEGVFVPEKHGIVSDELIQNAFSSTINSDKMNDKLKNKEINVTNRNVAMSKVANLFGMGEVIEQSKTITIKEKSGDGDKVQKGNLMSKARGKSAIESAKDSFKRENENGKKMNEIEKIKDRDKMAQSLIDPNLQKQLSSLQILDYICGQGDRHNANYFVEQNDGKFSNVHGIDNDMSFSDGVDLESTIKNGFGKNVGNGNEKQKNRFKGQNLIKTRMVVDSKNNLVIPHMDYQLAINIQNIKENEFRDVLNGLIEPEFIEFAILRLKKVQIAIKKEFQKKDSKVFVKDGQWNEETHNDFMKAGKLNKIVDIWKKKENDKKKAEGKEANTTDEEIFYKLNTYDIVDLSEEERYEAIYSNSYYADFVANLMGINTETMVFASGMKHKSYK